jgi:DNA-binding MarR family transcriptional regulator
MGLNTNRSADDDVQSVLDSIRRIVQFIRLSARSADRAGISAAQLFVLHKLAESPALSVNELAARTLTHQSSVSVVLQRLQARRLVARRRGGEDGRRVEVSLTARGQQLLRRVPDASQARLIAGVSRLPARQRRELARGLRSLVRTLGVTITGHPPMFFEDPAPRSRR